MWLLLTVTQAAMNSTRTTRFKPSLAVRSNEVASVVASQVHSLRVRDLELKGVSSDVRRHVAITLNVDQFLLFETYGIATPFDTALVVQQQTDWRSWEVYCSLGIYHVRQFFIVPNLLPYSSATVTKKKSM